MCPKGRKRALLKSPSNALVLQRRAELDEIALEGGGGRASGLGGRWGEGAVGEEVLEASENFGAVELGAGGGVWEMYDAEARGGSGGSRREKGLGGGGMVGEAEWVEAGGSDAAAGSEERSAGGRARGIGEEGEAGRGLGVAEGEGRGVQEGVLEDSVSGGELVMLRDVCVDPRTQVLCQSEPGGLERRMRRYVAAAMWGGDTVVRERIWETFSANAVEEAELEEVLEKQVTSRYYSTDDRTERLLLRTAQRRDRQGTDCYFGPGGRRPELFKSDVSSFFACMSLADAVMPAEGSGVQGAGVLGTSSSRLGSERSAREVVLPGRGDVVSTLARAFARQRALAAEDEACALRRRALRGTWPGVAPRGMSERVISAPSPQSALHSPANSSRSTAAQHAENGGGTAERIAPGGVAPAVCVGGGEAGSGEEQAWAQHVAELGAFVLSLGEAYAHVASLLSRQSATLKRRRSEARLVSLPG